MSSSKKENVNLHNTEAKKFYRENVSYRSFRAVSAQTVKSLKKSVSSTFERKPSHSQLNNSDTCSPHVQQLTEQQNMCGEVNRGALDCSDLFSVSFSDTDDNGTPSKQKLIKKRATAKNLSSSKNPGQLGIRFKKEKSNLNAVKKCLTRVVERAAASIAKL